VSPSGKHRPLTIIITGLSGSGKTVVLNAFEDSGYFCVDNLPVTLIETFVNLGYKTRTISKVAIGVDIRERKFLTNFSDELSSLRKKYKIKIIFLEANDNALVRRFKETRRPHPLGYKDLKKAIRREVKLLAPVRHEADTILDTSALSPHQLRSLITESYLKKKSKDMTIGLVSFGYKYGTPSEADLLFDVRFLPNPFFIEGLKELPGTSGKVKEFVLSHKESKEFLRRLKSLLLYLVPLYKKEGRSYLTIGIGCTGGRHRSPALCEEIRKFLLGKKYNVSLNHRDL
jgi:UPF0042 nucleotide-binding protein